MKWLLKGKPYDVQTAALKQIDGKRGHALWMEMGLGKTAVALNEFLHLFMHREVDGMVVVCPYGVTGVWRKEVEKWVDGQVDLVIWPNVVRPRQNVPWIQVLYYEAISVGGAKGKDLIDSLLERFLVYLVIEEAIEIKRHDAKRTQYLIPAAPKAVLVRELCGWPIVQGPHDMWSQLRAMGAIKGTNYYAFRNHFCVMGGWKGKQVVAPRKDTAPELEQLMQEWGFQALKKGWTDLPEKQYPAPREFEMDPVSRATYQQMEEEFVAMVGSVTVTANMVATQYNKLQQISSGFIYDEQGNHHFLTKLPNKAKELLAVIEQNPRSKFIVAAHFKPSIELLLGLLKDHRPAKMIGGMQPRDLDAEEDRFNNDQDCRVALCQAAASKYGRTLLGTARHPCHITIFYENTLDLNARIQLEDRNHRHGQRNPVTYVDFVCSPVERKATVGLQRKLTIGKMFLKGGQHEVSRGSHQVS